MLEKDGDFHLIIHGHFYQPPREDPWTGVIDRQDSAWPYHDWNERINVECYAANGDARTLDRHGHIENIINNYRYISFNFGPTLIGWIEANDPEGYAAILAADRLSAEANDGHGNAIAQVYNHIIMPLANRRDKYTQIRWGLADFRRRFGRDSEGIWLAETAINQDTVDVLIDCGIRFIILSPTQAEAVRETSDGEWLDVSHNAVDTTRPYLVAGTKGALAVFFYDMDISKAVGFEHILNSAENYRNRILSVRRPGQAHCMVNIATDGESYGHHEPFANMCLASLIDDNRNHNHFRMTNYGWYLAQFPPTAEARLKTGNNGLGTAWSCAHGVGRWMEDCGCSGGGGPGWNQRWRGPLRSAFDYLRDTLATASEKAAASLLTDFWAARDDYISVMADDGEGSFAAFLQRQAKSGIDESGRRLVRCLMEAQKYALFMYTSCGWFFSELSGLETVQCLRYAARALELGADILPADCEALFLEKLEHAPSNIPHFLNGGKIWQDLVRRQILDAPRVVNQYVLQRLLSGEDADERMYSYRIRLEDVKETIKDETRITAGVAHLADDISHSEKRLVFYVIRGSHLDIVSYVKASSDPRLREYLDLLIAEEAPASIRSRMGEWFNEKLSLADLKFDYKEKLVAGLFRNAFLELHALRSAKSSEYLELLDFYARLGIPIPAVERSSMEALLNAEIQRQLELLETDEEAVDFEQIAGVLKAARATNLNVNRATVETLFAIKIRRRFEEFEATGAAEPFEQLIRLIDFANQSGLDFRRKSMENLVFGILRAQVLPLINEPSQWENGQVPVFVSRMLHLGEMLNIQVQSYQKRLEDMRLNLEGRHG